ncbi:MAG: hypothetical protein UMU75_07515 [Halomonas sp.]|nr:hypothetical protein [Halomonas sp.]
MNGMFDERYEKLMSLTFERDDWRRRAEVAERQLMALRQQLDELQQHRREMQPSES